MISKSALVQSAFLGGGQSVCPNIKRNLKFTILCSIDKKSALE
ncbi:hypothetical protein BATR1942_20775 [Bacillus atrophaeus 1942]|uniref:Uncharacterized protein n=1 Tax=Bacillus atrophaeus (strain 1942) TaxID=720555 RepID=A0ABN3ZGB2_BACA1|nr:hypothetical protein BATR1942_20775 [Bacillus atrophaeus 1942]EIM09694.1 hypothetical protein UY9_16231 [Bacillus atrophaeus C89]